MWGRRGLVAGARKGRGRNSPAVGCCRVASCCDGFSECDSARAGPRRWLLSSPRSATFRRW
eukprot:102930-Chlamydomonas_euryale.AAC.5